MTLNEEREERALGTRCCSEHAPLSDEEARSLSQIFDVLAHPVRVQLLHFLAQHEGRVCVCDLEAAVSVKQPTVSHHLKLLRKAGIVGADRHGVWAYYYVNKDALAAFRDRADGFLDGLG